MNANSPTRENGDVLEGWKTIAAYFRRGPRTVQIWERENGLPVHRFQGRVLAYPAELDEWRRRLQVRPKTRPNPYVETLTR